MLLTVITSFILLIAISFFSEDFNFGSRKTAEQHIEQDF